MAVQMPIQTDDDLLTASEVMALLKVSRSTITNLMRRGDLVPATEPNPALLNQAHLFRRSDVERVPVLVAAARAARAARRKAS